MHRTEYSLKPKSGAWTAHPDAHSADCRLLRFDMTVEHGDGRVGGNNIQLVVGAPDQERRGLDEDVALTLESGWWIALRNQFADAPCVASEIVESVKAELSEITSEATAARGPAAEDITRRLFSTVFDATGPGYWQ